MNLLNVMNEITAAVNTIADLRVKPWHQETLTPPAALVTLPASINYHGTYGTGVQMIEDLTVVVLVGKSSDRVALKRIAAYAAATGASSVKAAIEGATYTSLSTINVDSCEFDNPEYDGTEYLAAIFHCSITGPAT